MMKPQRMSTNKSNRRDHIVAPPDCTGCSLCANVCGHDAIAMVWSEEGFLIPQVDEAACVGCGLCVLKCPALRERPRVQDELRDSVPTFGAWHRDAEVHRASSSGGVFTALASWVLAQGEAVCSVWCGSGRLRVGRIFCWWQVYMARCVRWCSFSSI